MHRVHARIGQVAIALFCACATSGAWAADLEIRSFDNNGQLTFTRFSSGEVYRIEGANTLTGEWTRLTSAATVDGIPTTLDCLPGSRGSGIVTCSVPINAESMFYRPVAELGDMALIPAGSFLMGATTNFGPDVLSNEVPQHAVYISAFYMDRCQVTKAKWNEVKAWATNNGYSSFPTGGSKATNYPVYSVSWYNSVRWCNARSELEGLTPCYTTNGVIYKTSNTTDEVVCNWSADGYRLPTEAEREKAARGGVANHRYPWHDTDTIQHARANYTATTNKYDYDTSPTIGRHPAYKSSQTSISPVKAFAPNGYGLYDMGGNLFDWCWDWHSDTYYASSPDTDPHGPDVSPTTNRIVRGGSYDNEATSPCCAHRGLSSPVTVSSVFGFRCVRRP